MENARELLEEAGSSLDHVTMVTTYLTDPGYRVPVYRTVADHLRGNHTVGHGVDRQGPGASEMKVELDLEAVVPETAPHRKYRKMNSRDWYGEAELDHDSCFLVDTGDEIFLRGQIGTELDERTMHGPGFTVADAAAQADQAMKNARTLLSEAGSGLEDVMKTRIYVGDRAYREAAYQAIGRHFGDISHLLDRPHRARLRPPRDPVRDRHGDHPEQGYAAPALRPVHTDEVYRDGQKLGMRFCQSVRAGNVVHLRGQTGSTLEGEFPFPGDPAAQADQAMKNIAVLLEEAGAVTRRHLQDSHLHPAPRAPRGRLPRRRPASPGGAPVRHRPHRRWLRPPRDPGRDRRGRGHSGLKRRPRPGSTAPPGPQGPRTGRSGGRDLRIGCGERVVAEPRRLADPDLRDPPSGRVAREEELERVAAVAPTPRPPGRTRASCRPRAPTGPRELGNGPALRREGRIAAPRGLRRHGTRPCGSPRSRGAGARRATPRRPRSTARTIRIVSPSRLRCRPPSPAA